MTPSDAEMSDERDGMTPAKSQPNSVPNKKIFPTIIMSSRLLLRVAQPASRTGAVRSGAKRMASGSPGTGPGMGDEWATQAQAALRQAQTYANANPWTRYAAGGVAVLGGMWLVVGGKKGKAVAGEDGHSQHTAKDDARNDVDAKIQKYTKSLANSNEKPSTRNAPGSSSVAKGSAVVSTPAKQEDEDICMRDKMAAFVRKMQAKIVDSLDAIEVQAAKELGITPKLLVRDEWIRAEGGAGLSCVLQNGNVFEKAGVLVSVVHGPASPELIKQMRARKKEGIMEEGNYRMFAAGCSMVLHPHNPNAPTAHLNYRYFELSREGEDKPAAAWFGGGCDLTPSYLYEEDAVQFHQVIKDVCDKHDASYYPKFKKWCDDYFYVPHRKEMRGVGGIFFDDMEHGDHNKIFKWVEECGLSFTDQYMPIIRRRWNAPFSEEMKRWQQLCRGRYVEFNLVYDRGTKFGLVTPGARIESIMCSLPLTARWEYMHEPAEGSREAELVKVLKAPREWVV
ncbi:Coproporphyrinogen III oxidase [Chytriomyces sp. MP71]|nr:Coproporphyrinogen III oxidase [Chytriomyces sp. MP71]